MIDSILPRKDINILQVAGITLIIIILIAVVTSFMQDFMCNVLSGNFAFNIKNHIMKHLQNLPIPTIQKMKAGGIASKLQQDCEVMSNLPFEIIISPLNALVMFSVAITSLSLVNWKVSVLCVAFSIIIFFIGFFVFNIMHPFQLTLREHNSTINAKITEIFSGIQIVRCFRRENRVRRLFESEIGFFWRKTLYGNILGIFVQKLTLLIFYLMQISIWFIGGYYIIKGTMSLGDVVVFVSFVPWIFNPIFNIMAFFPQVQKSLACAEKIFELLDEKIDIVDTEDALNIESIKEGIKFHNVSFKYLDGSEVLSNVSFTIPKGKVTAVVGPSGAGKSTITNLLLGFYDVNSGKITIDDTNIKQIKIGAYRKLLSFVPQDTFLFDGTIAENISFGKFDANMEEIEKVAKITHCDEFIIEMKNKYETNVGERGTKLSGGQKQRIALARAIISNPQLLILDEATSNLDSISEGLIQDALNLISQNRTCVVIAHRLSTIINADNIVVLNKGKVIEQGSHSELLRNQGMYFKMYSKQIKKKKSTEVDFCQVED